MTDKRVKNMKEKKRRKMANRIRTNHYEIPWRDRGGKWNEGS